MVDKKRISIRLLSILIFWLILFLHPSFSVFAQDYKDDEIIVRFRPSLTYVDRFAFHREMSSRQTGIIDKLGIEVIKVENRDFKTILDRLQHDPRVLYAEPNYIATTYELTNDPGVANNLQWGLFKIQAAATGVSAWNLSKGADTVKVAVIDTGIDFDHEDLLGKVVANRNCTDSYTSDDLYGHGTHVAGIIAAIPNNRIGIAGLGYNVSLINAKALGDAGSGYYSWIADCIVWAADNGAKVINMSLGGGNSSKALDDALQYAYKKGSLLVAAAGNSGSSSPSYPAYNKNVISVAAIDKDDHKPNWSNWGSWVDVAAPGVTIYSTLPNHPNAFKQLNYGYLSGTSMATPFVSALAGLIFRVASVDNLSTERIIEDNADKTAGTGISWIYGRINTYKSLSSLNSISPIAPTAPITPTAIPLTVTPTATPSPTSTPTPTVITSPTPTATAPPSSPKPPWLMKLCNRYPWICK